MKSRKTPDPARTGGDWHAVSVVPGRPPCDAAMRIRSTRFLAAEAPRIPIVDCTWPALCRCTYRHYADRRAGPRRLADRGMYSRPVPTERRKAADRRRADS